MTYTETIKRENIKNKYYIIVRDSKKRIISQRKWSKQFSLHKAKSVYAQNKTLYTDTQRDVSGFKNVDMMTVPYKHRTPKTNYMIECTIKSKNIHNKNISVSGRSSYKTTDEEGKRLGKQEAYENAVLRWQNAYYGQSGSGGDFQEGQDLMKNVKPTIEYKIIYFRQK